MCTIFLCPQRLPLPSCSPGFDPQAQKKRQTCWYFQGIFASTSSIINWSSFSMKCIYGKREASNKIVIFTLIALNYSWGIFYRQMFKNLG